MKQNFFLLYGVYRRRRDPNKDKHDVYNKKNIVYYSALLNAWIMSKMEKDRTLLTISAGGIALLVTLLSTIGIRYLWELLLYTGSFFCFTLTIVFIIIIFDKNSEYIAELLNRGSNQVVEKKVKTLMRYDRYTMISFIIALILSIIIAVNSAYQKLNEYQGDIMKKNQKNFCKPKSQPLNESFFGLENLAPTKPTDSVQGLEKLAPQDKIKKTGSSPKPKLKNSNPGNEK